MNSWKNDGNNNQVSTQRKIRHKTFCAVGNLIIESRTSSLRVQTV